MTKYALLLVSVLIMAAMGQTPDYTEAVNKLKDAITQPNFKHKAYERLAYISDTYGPRLWGSAALEKTILEVYDMALKEGFQNVRLEAVKNFTKWVRVNEELYLHSPRIVPQPLKVIGLGGSVPGHVTANAIVVSNYDQLQAKKDQVKGKIVVYNAAWTIYGQTVAYRSSGAWRAAKYGAVGALVRSVTPVSIQSVHTGIQHYSDAYPKIPVAAIATEDAEMLARMQARGQNITLQLNLENYEVPNTYSNNVVFQIVGSSKPEQILLMGGHIDSWDTGSQTGTNDDAGGFISCFEAMRLLLKNGLIPKRTIRFIAWSGEEWGGVLNGAHSYLVAHKQQLKNHIVAFEDDLGSTTLLGFGYTGSADGKAVVSSISDKYMGLINAGKLTDNGEAVDTGPLRDIGIPTMVNFIQDTEDHNFYFTYHHSAGDSITMMDPDMLDSNVLGIASMFYILADLENSIPKPNIKVDKLEELVRKVNAARMGAKIE